jgi:hypothetical protein
MPYQAAETGHPAGAELGVSGKRLRSSARNQIRTVAAPENASPITLTSKLSCILFCIDNKTGAGKQSPPGSTSEFEGRCRRGTLPFAG